MQGFSACENPCMETMPQTMDELFEVALTWVDGDRHRAALLVSAYMRGATDRAMIESRTMQNMVEAIA